MNILELCLSPGLGGLELYVYRSQQALANGNKVTAVLLEGGRLDTYYHSHSSIQPLYMDNGRNPLPLVRARKLAKIIDDNDIDVIHMHWGKDLPLAVFAKLLSSKKPSIIYTRQMMITRYKNDVYHRFLYRHVNLLLTITMNLESLCRQYISIDDGKIRTLYYGVKAPEKQLTEAEMSDIRKEKDFQPDDFVVGLFGRLEDGKGQHLLIKAIAQAAADNKTVKALVVGHEMTEGYRSTLEKLADDLGVSHQVYFNGFTDRPQELMQICDCVLLASYEETFGLVLPEAMRAGVAVIGSDAGGVPEIIEHQDTGLLFKPKDVDDLYRQIAYLLDDSDKKTAIANQGKLKADKMFNNEIHFDTLQRLFLETL